MADYAGKDKKKAEAAQQGFNAATGPADLKNVPGQAKAMLIDAYQGTKDAALGVAEMMGLRKPEDEKKKK